MTLILELSDLETKGHDVCNLVLNTSAKNNVCTYTLGYIHINIERASARANVCSVVLIGKLPEQHTRVHSSILATVTEV